MSVLHASDLVIDIPDRPDGEPIHLSVAPGQVWGILGPNGAGKSTLLHTLAGLRPARRGQVALADRSLSQWGRRRVAQQLGIVFQDHHDGFPATVLETALIGRHPYLSPWQMESGEDVRLAQQALTTLDLAGMEHRLIHTLSGGERQRVALATTLTQSPRLWLVDEPTNHLDLRHQVQVMELLSAQAQAGQGVVMCLHDLNLAARWCTHILLLYPDGQCCSGPASEMLVPSALEELYDQKLSAVEIDGAPVFVPRV